LHIAAIDFVLGWGCRGHPCPRGAVRGLVAVVMRDVCGAPYAVMSVSNQDGCFSSEHPVYCTCHWAASTLTTCTFYIVQILLKYARHV